MKRAQTKLANCELKARIRKELGEEFREASISILKQTSIQRFNLDSSTSKVSDITNSMEGAGMMLYRTISIKIKEFV